MLYNRTHNNQQSSTGNTSYSYRIYIIVRHCFVSTSTPSDW